MMRSALLFLMAAAAVSHAAQPTTFKVQTELVRVDVLVERNGRPVAGLAARDFIVEDNGVPQQISLLPASEAVAASAVLDVSGSMTPEKLNAAAAGVRALMAALRGPDRHALYAFAGDVRRLVLPAPHESLAAETIAGALREASGPRTSLFDALFAAILQDDAGAGPRMLTVLTDGRDNTSFLNARAVIDAALRHETVIYAVAVGQDSSASRLGVPPMLADDGRRLLQVLADRTGGRLIDAAWSSDLASIFASIIDEYRQRYILTFVPTGVAKNPRVALLYFDQKASAYVTLIGQAALVNDPEEKSRRWKEDWVSLFKDRNKGDDYLLLRVTPERLEISSPSHGLQNDPGTWRPVVLVLR